MSNQLFLYYYATELGYKVLIESIINFTFFQARSIHVVKPV